ncbi:unnamed protein product [Cyclocybe aegerita]|uniref:T6SS Phospholipase effector Tle1-like catalytic domain-containing protein n=1 Tax=Cyclocybe aegerita TaxID=1973307 RepID=A0A8S0WIX7_CYCAE|nr:unnamed protein product [Cyclocybe aegerita]
MFLPIEPYLSWPRPPSLPSNIKYSMDGRIQLGKVIALWMAENEESPLAKERIVGSDSSSFPPHVSGAASRPDANVMPCGHKMNGRNLIVCIDSTANQFGDMNTNVIELYNLILKGSKERQLTWYNSGIGTYARPSWRSPNYYKQVLYHKIDLVIASTFDSTVKGSYGWISDRYEDGDCIFLFGFSRGAYQVRVLSAMIEKVGLIYKGNEMQIPIAYELYMDQKTGAAEVTHVGSEVKMTKAQRFKSAFSHPDVKVHFVGAWDTVSSIGIARGNKMPLLTVDGMGHVCYFRHALALDERRVKFLPEYTWGGSTKPQPNANKGKDTGLTLKAGEPLVEQGADSTGASRQAAKFGQTVPSANPDFEGQNDLDFSVIVCYGALRSAT